MQTDALAQLLIDTGHHHHQAYIDADGTDPEWAIWYAGYLQTRVWDSFGSVPTRSRLVYLLLGAEAAHRDSGGGAPWPTFYAAFLAGELEG